MMMIHNDYEPGDVVFIKTDADQLERMVTQIEVYGPQDLQYTVRCGTVSSTHFGYELSKEKNLLKTL